MHYDDKYVSQMIHDTLITTDTDLSTFYRHVKYDEFDIDRLVVEDEVTINDPASEQSYRSSSLKYRYTTNEIDDFLLEGPVMTLGYSTFDKELMACVINDIEYETVLGSIDEKLGTTTHLIPERDDTKRFWSRFKNGSLSVIGVSKDFVSVEGRPCHRFKSTVTTSLSKKVLSHLEYVSGATTTDANQDQEEYIDRMIAAIVPEPKVIPTSVDYRDFDVNRLTFGGEMPVNRSHIPPVMAMK